jgi:Protein of unknown function (DUF4058)
MEPEQSKVSTMPSPFPGIDPYVENPEFWSEVHNRLIVAIADSLAPQLRPRYRVVIEKRTYLNDDTESLLVGIADVAILPGRSTPASSSSAATLPARHKLPQKVTVPLPEAVRESYLEIREVSGGQVITTLEILSPKNKPSGTGRSTYERKRQQILASDTHFVEIDLLRSGTPMPLLGRFTSMPYYILVSRAHQRPSADLYPFTLQEEIPLFSVPLMPDEPEPEVDLQTLFNSIYDRAGLDLVIDYAQPPVPAFDKEDVDWVETWLREKGLRS